MFAAAGAMALSNPLFLNPLLLSQFISAQQSNTDEPKLNFNQVTTKFLLIVLGQKAPVD